MIAHDQAVQWLLQSRDPSLPYLTRKDVLKESGDFKDFEYEGKRILQSPR